MRKIAGTWAMSVFDRVKQNVPPALLFSMTLFFFIPLGIYTTNPDEFGYGLVNVAIALLLVALLPALLICLVGVMISFRSDNISRAFGLVLVFLALVLWSQANILLPDFGILDGSEINWSDYDSYVKIEIFVWVLMVALLISFRSKAGRHLKSICLFLIIYQLAVSGATAFQNHENFKTCYSAPRFDYTFSKNKNILILTLDSFSGDVFDRIITDDPVYADMFEGFVFYDDALAGYPHTFASIPLILTNQYYKNEQPFDEFLQQNKQDSIVNFLARQGFQSDVSLINYGNSLYAPLSEEASVERGSFFMSRYDLSKMLSLTAFYCAPVWMKEKSYDFFTRQQTFDLKFMNQFASEAQVAHEKNVFKYIHLEGNHPPFIMNEDLKYDPDMGDDAVAVYRQGRGALKIAANVIETLKNIGVYDNTLIFIIGDHGDEFTYMRGNPLFLVKDFDSSHALSKNSAPVVLADINRTVADALKLDNDYPGYSVLKESFPLDRVRRFYNYHWTKEYKDLNQNYLPPANEFLVIGNHSDPASWIKTLSVYSRDGKDRQTVALEQTLNFGSKSIDIFLDHGFSPDPESSTQRWTVGDEARLILPVDLPDEEKDIILNIKYTGFVDYGISTEVVVNGEALGRLTSDETEAIIKVPSSLFQYEHLLVVDLKLSDTRTSPVEGDTRKLGFLIESMVLR